MLERLEPRRGSCDAACHLCNAPCEIFDSRNSYSVQISPIFCAIQSNIYANWKNDRKIGLPILLGRWNIPWGIMVVIGQASFYLFVTVLVCLYNFSGKRPLRTSSSQKLVKQLHKISSLVRDCCLDLRGITTPIYNPQIGRDQGAVVLEPSHGSLIQVQATSFLSVAKHEKSDLENIHERRILTTTVRSSLTGPIIPIYLSLKKEPNGRLGSKWLPGSIFLVESSSR